MQVVYRIKGHNRKYASASGSRTKGDNRLLIQKRGAQAEM